MLTAALVLLLAAAPASTPLLKAVKDGDREAAVALLDKRADVNTPEPDGTTALHWAVQQNDADLVVRLLRAGAKADVKNQYGATPLAGAALVGNTTMIRALLEAGADVESPNPDGQTALMLVARTGNVEAAKRLVDRGANVNAVETWREQTALTWAAAQRQPEMVKFLLANGAKVDGTSMVTPWKRQVSSEPRALHRPVGGVTALLFAAREGCVECGRHLADAGADLDKADPENITPLLLALINGHFDLAKLLIERGADVNRWDVFGRTPLYVAIDMNTVPHGGRPDQPSLDETAPFQIAEMLLARGANANSQLKLLPPYRNILDDRGNDRQLQIGATPLLRASKAFDVPAMQLLLKHGAIVDLPNAQGHTPIYVAAGGASVDSDSRGYFTTEDVELRSVAALKVLLEAGANINATESSRRLTPLHDAARWGWNDVITFLVANGADIHAKDVKGLTAVDSALGRTGGNSRFGQRIDVFEDTAAMLRKLGAVEGTAAGSATRTGAAPGRGAGK